jgi:transposase
MQFLGHWARKLSWKETAEEFRTTWDKVRDAVEYLVTWGLEHRVLGPIRAIGVDGIQRGKGHKYLTLVYQIDLGCTRLLWIGQERTVKTFREFFAMIGPEVSAKIEFVSIHRRLLYDASGLWRCTDRLAGVFTLCAQKFPVHGTVVPSVLPT